MGKNNDLYPKLKVHGDDIHKAETEKYLGDQVSNDCSNKRNIKERKGKGLVL